MQGILGDTWQGYLQTGGYSGHMALGQRKGVEHAGYGAHIRRRFYELYVLQHTPEHLLDIQNLIERRYEIKWGFREWGSRGESDILWFQAERSPKVQLVFLAISARLSAQRTVVAPQSPFGKAIGYAIGSSTERFAMSSTLYLLRTATRRRTRSVLSSSAARTGCSRIQPPTLLRAPRGIPSSRQRRPTTTSPIATSAIASTRCLASWKTRPCPYSYLTDSVLLIDLALSTSPCILVSTVFMTSLTAKKL